MVLTGIVERYGDENIEFADVAFTFDAKCRPHRRVLLLTNEVLLSALFVCIVIVLLFVIAVCDVCLMYFIAFFSFFFF